MKYEIIRTKEFKEWFEAEPIKAQLQIAKRLSLIETEGHFGSHKHVADLMWELKWANGRRLYYAYLEEWNLLLLLGGNKNGQSQDINKAKKLLKRYQEGTS